MTQPNSNTPPKTSFGHLIRAAREAAGLSLRDVAAEADVSKSMLGKLEQDEIQSPNPRLLEALAPTLGIELIDLYSAAGYVPAKGLPNFSPYLRSKYRDLPPEARTEIEASFTEIASRYGIAERGPAPGEDE